MSAVLKTAELAPMLEQDLGEVLAIEQAIYTHPWTRGNFADSLRAGYECRSYRLNGERIGSTCRSPRRTSAAAMAARSSTRRPALRARSAQRTSFWRCGRATTARR